MVSNLPSMPQLLRAVLDFQASDLHLSSGAPPTLRVHGQMIRTKLPGLTPESTKALCYSVLTDMQRAILEEQRQLDFSFSLRDLARFRGNIFYQRGSISGAFRHIPGTLPQLEQLGLPGKISELAQRPHGLILVTGATGSGKSTTLAAMLDRINQSEAVHIVTIEDPIEHLHRHSRSLVNQREIGSDAKSFSLALRAALREDPDVVLVGEMRDRETIESALLLAETGHLVLSTLHTNSAPQTISRIVQVFPTDAQEQIRLQLSLVLEGVVTQTLLPRADKKGRVVAVELMIPNPSIRNLVRENKIFQIPSAIMVGQEKTGMQTMNQSLIRLVSQGIVEIDKALQSSPDPEDFMRMLSQSGRHAA